MHRLIKAESCQVGLLRFRSDMNLVGSRYQSPLVEVPGQPLLQPPILFNHRRPQRAMQGEHNRKTGPSGQPHAEEEERVPAAMQVNDCRLETRQVHRPLPPEPERQHQVHQPRLPTPDKLNQPPRIRVRRFAGRRQGQNPLRQATAGQLLRQLETEGGMAIGDGQARDDMQHPHGGVESVHQ
jgi:hypothetical protein